MIDNLVVTIMAGGVGKRMKSELPKVLHKFKGIPMIVRILKECLELKIKKIIIITGKFDQQIRNTIKDYLNEGDFIRIHFVVQSIPLGTGDAIKYSLEKYNDNEEVIILNGDMPLINKELIKNFYNYTKNNCILVAELEDSKGYGRIIYENDNFKRIKEEKDCNDKEKMIKIVNSGLYKIRAHDLKEYIPKIKNDNKQEEYYLTDIIELLVNDNKEVETYILNNNQNKLIMGVNSREDLINLENMI